MLILANQPGRLFRQKGSRPTNDGRRCKRETYGFADWLGMRAGRVKIPFGLYNEVNDVDSGRAMQFGFFAGQVDDA